MHEENSGNPINGATIQRSVTFSNGLTGSQLPTSNFQGTQSRSIESDWKLEVGDWELTTSLASDTYLDDDRAV